MAVTLYEKVSSRSLETGREDASLTAEFIAIGSSDETAVYQAAVLDTPKTYFNLVRSRISIAPRDVASYWDVSVDYTQIPIEEVEGEDAKEPTTPDPGQPLGPNFSFRTGGGTTKITQSLATISRTRRLGLGAPDHKQAIGVTKDGVEGCDIISRQIEFSVEVKRKSVTIDYFKNLELLTSKVNNAKFLHFEAGEVLYLGCDGKQSYGEAWVLSHSFAVSRNRTDIVITDEITVPAKKGWEYLWVEYGEAIVGGNRIRRAETAFVEQVYELANFAVLGWGAIG